MNALALARQQWRWLPPMLALALLAGTVVGAQEAGKTAATEAETLFQRGMAALPSRDDDPQKKAKFEAGLALFQKAVQKAPSFAVAHLQVGYCLRNLGRSTEAIKAYKEAIRLQPDLAKPHYILGVAYAVQGERGLALEEYKILKDLDKDLAAELFDLLYP